MFKLWVGEKCRLFIILSAVAILMTKNVISQEEINFQGLPLGKGIKLVLENCTVCHSEDIIVQYEGQEIEIGFNSKYILEIINQLEDEKLILEFNDSNSPLIIKESSNNDLIYVLMPMRV